LNEKEKKHIFMLNVTFQEKSPSIVLENREEER